MTEDDYRYDEDPPILAWSVLQNVVEGIFNGVKLERFYEEVYRFESFQLFSFYRPQASLFACDTKTWEISV